MRIQRGPCTAMLIGTIVCTLAGSGCDRGSSEPATTPAPVATSGAGTNYFGDRSFIGRTVTVAGIVNRVITETSFVLDTRDFGDESLLVLCAPAKKVTVGYRVQISGNVQEFHYRVYADEYDLSPDSTAYAAFRDERILVTAEAMSGAANPDD